MVFIISLVLLFIIRLKYGRKPVLECVYNRYGELGLKEFRRLDTFDFKLRKLLCDLDFLLCCLNNHLTPHFLKFKTSSSRLINDSNYREYQRSLLQKEIDFKRRSIVEMKNLKSEAFSILKEHTSFLDFNHFIFKIQERNSSKIENIKSKMQRKLFNLGLSCKYEKLPIDKIIINISFYTLIDIQKEALSLGLKFRFNPIKIDYTGYFLSFEKLVRMLVAENIFQCIPNSLDYVKTNIKSIALKYYYSFRSKLSPYHKSLIDALKELSRNKDLVITQPDKGTGVVLMNKMDYIRKMEDILQDTSKFVISEENLFKSVIKLEDKHNRLMDTLFKNNIIDGKTKDLLKASGSRPGIMYGLPKVHKPDVPMRPILSTRGTHNYDLSQYLSKILTPCIDNSFIVSDSFEFVKDILEIRDSNCVMASFDIKSLYTNIPIDETCNIILNKLFPSSDSIYMNYDKKSFEKILNDSVKNNLFIFNNKMYFQRDGTPMGGCISAALANIFLSHHEQFWLRDCPKRIYTHFFPKIR